MATREKKFYAPILKHYRHDIRKRWRVEYLEPLHNGHHAKRIVIYGDINKGQTIEERTRLANTLINNLIFDRPKEKTLLDTVMETGRLEWRFKTISAYNTVVNKFQSYLRPTTPETATEQTINSFLLHLQTKGSNQRTIYKYRNTLYSLYSRAVAQNLTKYNPVKKAVAIKRTATSLAYFTEGQMKAIKEECEGSQLWLSIQLLFYCFIRPGEQRLLKISDINFEMGYIEIRGEISKNKKTEKVVIPAHFAPQLDHLRQYPNGYYILGKQGTPAPLPVGIRHINDAHKKVLNKLLIRGRYAFYSWKHTGVVRCVQAGLNIRDIQNQLRHHSLDMVQEYLKNLGVLQSIDLKNRYPQL